jgi:hypothetical protein
MDDADRARRHQAAENARAATHRKPVPAISAVGYCHACGELIEGQRLFCGSACAEEYDRIEGHKR